MHHIKTYDTWWNTRNSAIAQAKAFHEMVGIDGIIVTKLDGTAKGGALFSISNQLELPIFMLELVKTRWFNRILTWKFCR